MIRSANAVLIVTHSMNFVHRICHKAIWLAQGRVIHVGPAAETVALYEAETKKRLAGRKNG